jgi:hypothetical protein
VNALSGSQTDRDEDMDNRNNNLVAHAPEFRTWEDVVAWARGKIIDAAPHDGDGREGRAFWYDKQPVGWRPDFTDVPITPIEKSGPEHRYDADEGDASPDAPSPRASTRDDPLDRPVASWTEDVRIVIGSPAYLEPQHSRRAEAERKVRAWFERRFSRGPVPVDATGRAIRDRGHTAVGTASACPVPVHAHSRDGGKVEVGAHCRSRPAA